MIPLSADTWGAEELAAIERIAKGGHYTIGKEVQKFEQAYADYCGSNYCVAVNSGSSANLLMVAAWTLTHGPGTVIVPAVGWATSYSPFQQYGWKLRFVDIDRDTLNYDLKKLHAASDYADAILAINLLGNPNDFAAFPNLPVFEDNCEAMGAVYKGKKTGTFGVMSSHSTYFSHHMCTIEGGMVTTDDEYFRDMLLSLRSHGWTRHLGEDNLLGHPPEKFSFILPGYNVRPTEMQAAIGLEQLKKLPGFIEARRENAARFPYRKQKEIGESSWFGFAVYGEDRNHVIDRFETRPVVTGNFLRQPVIKHYDFEVHGDTRGADYVHDNCLMIGNSHRRIEWGRM